MNELVYLKNEQALTDSLTVAEIFGKRHDQVLRAIDSLVESLAKNEAVDDHKNEAVKLFIRSRYKDKKGEYRKRYLMNHKDCKKRMETVKEWTVMEGVAI